MKPWYKRWYFIILFVIIIIILLPLPYTIPIISATRYNEGDILGFYGNIIGAGATLVVFFFMIGFTTKNQKEERRISVKPQLQTKLYPYDKNKLFYENASNFIMFLEYHEDARPIEGSYTCPVDFLKDTKKREHVSSLLRGFEGLQNYLVLKCDIANIGSNSAVSINISINDKPAPSGFSLPVGVEESLFYVFGKEILKSSSGKNPFVKKERVIKFVYSFKDVVALTEYEQCESITVTSDSDDVMGYYQIGNDRLNEPKEIRLH